jgi:hypothetical protein
MGVFCFGIKNVPPVKAGRGVTIGQEGMVMTVVFGEILLGSAGVLVDQIERGHRAQNLRAGLEISSGLAERSVELSWRFLRLALGRDLMPGTHHALAQGTSPSLEFEVLS